MTDAPKWIIVFVLKVGICVSWASQCQHCDHIQRVTSDLGTKVCSHNTKHLFAFREGMCCKPVQRLATQTQQYKLCVFVCVHGAKLSMKF